jgi:hypothetical protein
MGTAILAVSCNVAQALLVLGLVLPSGSQLRLAAPPAQPDAERDRLFNAAKSANDAASALASMFAQASRTKLEALKTDDCAGVALQAAWEEVLLSLPEGEQTPPVSVDTQLLQYFVGFVEGRTHLAAPSWWKRGVLKEHAYKRTNVFFPILENQPYVKAGMGFQAPRGASFEAHPGGLRLKVNEESVPIRSAVMEGRGLANRVSAMIDGDHCYLTVHHNRCIPCRLYCIERRSGRIVWRSLIWAAGIKSYTGTGFHWISLVSRKGLVCVFGLGDNCAYVEAFGKADGANQYRFSTTH